MRKTFPDPIEHGRIRSGEYASRPGETFGAFRVRGPGGETLCIIASDGDGWEHVSVSLAYRCPTWEEMSWVKSAFFKPSETVMQLHVPDRLHVNYHEFCLHLWRPLRAEIPLPDPMMVGPVSAGSAG